MRIKVCGMTSIEQLHHLGEVGADFAGFIFYPGSPRYVHKFGLAGSDVRKENLKLYKVGVFVDSPYQEIMKQVEDFGLDMVQLHGNETPEECSRISEHIPVIKAFRVNETDNLEEMLEEYNECSDMFLFDAAASASDKNLYGGTGRKFDWNRLKGQRIGKFFFLSGGIEPNDVQLVQEFMKDPVAKDLLVVDINSRFESSPGVKNMEKVRQFINALKP